MSKQRITKAWLRAYQGCHKLVLNLFAYKAQKARQADSELKYMLEQAEYGCQVRQHAEGKHIVTWIW